VRKRGPVKSDTVFKRASNELLDRLAQGVPGGGLESEAKLAEAVRVSRTTIRKALRELTRRRVLKRRDAKLVIARRPTKNDYFPMADTIAASDRVERKLMEWISRGGRKPGDYVNGLELARDFGVSTSAVREYLSRFERYGLVEKRPNSGWIFRGFTPDFALELFEVRELFEIRSAKAFAAQPRGAPAWEALAAIEAEHLRLRKDIKWRYQDFSSLDERFHRLIYDASRNRFMEGFYDIISLIFHYHYQWRKEGEKQRNAVALSEHLDYIAALKGGDPAVVEITCRRHLKSARATLLASIT